MVKKIAALAGAGALLLGLAVPVLATGVTVNNWGTATQYTTANATANTGHNWLGWFSFDDGVDFGSIVTGPAYSDALSQSMANQFTTSVVSVGGTVVVSSTGYAGQGTTANAYSNTGHNDLDGFDWDEDFLDGGMINTGGAVSFSTSQAWANLFTTNVVKY